MLLIRAGTLYIFLTLHILNHYTITRIAMPSFNDTITFQYAQSISCQTAFNLMIKPAGSLCNLDCAYCYYLDKSLIYNGIEPKMSIGNLEKFVQAYINANNAEEVTFNWHGGEPLVLGLDFYKQAVLFEKKYSQGKRIRNTIQTNGTLLNKEWAEFLASEDFLVGVSVDGPEEVHDKYRKSRGGGPTLERVIRGIEHLYREGAQYNLMATINHKSEGRGAEVYRFLKSLGSRYIQFSPVIEHVIWADPDNASGKKTRPVIVDPNEEGASIAPWSVHPVAFGKFLCDIFDIWVKNDVGRYFINFFECTLANLCGVLPGTCSFAPTCGGNAIVEHNGDIYVCDHFVYPSYKIGNIYTDNLADVMNGPTQIAFGMSKRSSLPGKCQKCRFLNLCNGGCPKHRFNRTENGQTWLNALCEGYSMFFAHSMNAMETMRRLLENGRNPNEIMCR